MPIAKGMPWGEAGTLPEDGLIADTDAAAARAVDFARRHGVAYPTVGLTGGDLWRTLGAPVGGEARLRSGNATCALVDIGWVSMENGDEEYCFVAHCVARTPVWGRTIAIMNAEWVGEWDVAPRSHPGDGHFDVLEAALGWSERDQVRRRLPSGTHLPHPSINTSRTTGQTFEMSPSRRVYLDGMPFPRCRRLTVRVEPASLTVLV